MKSLRSRVLPVILVLSFINYTNGEAHDILNKVLPQLDEESFTKSFYLGSRISFLRLSSSSQNSTTERIFHSPTLDDLSSISDGESASSENLCATHLRYIIEVIWSNQNDVSVLAFMDSFAKPVPGVKLGNLDWHGNEKQCESITFPSKSELTSNFDGKYCRATWATAINSNHSLGHYTGICVPSSCGERDFRYLRSFLEKFFLLKISEKSQVVEISCKPEINMKIDSMIFYLVCCGLIFLGIMSSFYEKYFGRAVKKTKEAPKPSILSIFSIPENWRSLDGRRVSKHDILIIHYIRGFAALSVVLAHAIPFLSSKLGADPTSQISFVRGLIIVRLIPRIFMSIFFFLTGFLIHPDSNPLKSIFKAFIRLSPSYYLTLFAHTSYISTLGLGSKLDFGGVQSDRNQCSKVIWEHLLFIQNYLHPEKLCNITLWSVAVTFQLYIIGVFVVWILMRVPLIGISSTILLMIYGLVRSFNYSLNGRLDLVIGSQETPINVETLQEYERNMLTLLIQPSFQTSTWLCPFIMGILFAYYLPKIQLAPHPTQKKCVISTLLLIISFYAAFCWILNLEPSDLTCSLLTAIAPIGNGFILSMSIFIFHPRSKFIDYKLTSKTLPSFVHLSRISYPLYLTHYAAIIAISISVSLTSTLDTFSILCITGGCFVVFYLVSVFLYILVERPIQNIRKIKNF